MNHPPFDAVILAAGKGSRMRTTLRKPLLDLAGKPMLAHMVATMQRAGAKRIICLIPTGMEATFSKAVGGQQVTFVEQESPTGTADALALCLPKVREQLVVCVFVDGPLLRESTIERLCKIWRPGGFTLLNAIYPDPTGLGRIVRDLEGKVVEAVEEVEATPAQKAIKESWTGGIAGDAHLLRALLPQIEPLPNLKEKPLLGILPLCRERDLLVNASLCKDLKEVANANDQIQFAELEAIYRDRMLEDAIKAGLQCADPSTLQVQGTLRVEGPCQVGIGVRFEGNLTLGEGAVVPHFATLRDHYVTANTSIDIQEHVSQRIGAAGKGSQEFAIAPSNALRKLSAEEISNAEARGVFFADPSRIYVSEAPHFGDGCQLGVDVILEGIVTLGKGVCIGSNTLLLDSSVGDGSVVTHNACITHSQLHNDALIRPSTKITWSTLGANCIIGHSAYLARCNLAAHTYIAPLEHLNATTTERGV